MACPLQLTSPSASGISVTDPRHRFESFDTNQQTYERLKTCLGLNLRRQIWIGVCDDLRLRDRLAIQLQTDLERESGPSSLPKLVTLELNLQDPNPIAQVSDWLSHFPARARRATLPAFQILGIEQLTRQSAAYQNLFLSYLQETEQHLPLIESGLLLWMTQPWFRMLPEAAPEFWYCRTGIFEFVGDPTPLLTTSPERIQLNSGSLSRDLGRSSAPTVLPAVASSENPWLALADDLTLWYEPEDSDLQSKALDRTFNPEFHLVPALPSDLEPLDLAEWIADSPLDLSSLLQPRLSSEASLEAHLETSTALQPHSTNQIATLTAGITELGSADPDIADSGIAAELAPLEDADLLQHIGSLQQQIALLQAGEESPAMLATAYRTLGNFYRDCIEQGDLSAENLAMAIQAYEQTLQWPPESPLEQTELLNDLGNLYWTLAQSQPEDAPACLQRALQLYQSALDYLEPQQLETHAMLQNNLGGLFADLAHYQEPVLNLEQSVQAYQQALQCRTAEADPIRYASTQNNLGTTYWNLAQQQQSASNLRQAIIAYTEALSYYPPEHEPLHYAMIQNNLGTAYWNLAQYEQSKDYLILAALAYQSALQYRTLDSHPVGFAATQNNLGTAHWHLANQTQQAERRTYLEQAVSDYEMTLNAAEYLNRHQPDASLGFDLCSTQNNLGLAYYQLAVDPTHLQSSTALSHHLESALRYHLLALQGWETEPELRPIAVNCIVQTVRAFYSELGLSGQSQALGLLPSQLLAEILPRL